jgi:hypothetical protein
MSMRFKSPVFLAVTLAMFLASGANAGDSDSGFLDDYS